MNLWCNITAGGKPPDIVDVIVEVISDLETNTNTKSSGEPSY